MWYEASVTHHIFALVLYICVPLEINKMIDVWELCYALFSIISQIKHMSRIWSFMGIPMIYIYIYMGWSMLGVWLNGLECYFYQYIRILFFLGALRSFCWNSGIYQYLLASLVRYAEIMLFERFFSYNICSSRARSNKIIISSEYILIDWFLYKKILSLGKSNCKLMI